jgi:DNA-binding XRE family transcriptional regulator
LICQPELARVLTQSQGDAVPPDTYPPLPEGYRDINDVVADHERNPRRAQALARARKLIGNNQALFPVVTLSALRLQKGLSQALLAQRLGTSQSHISRIEAGVEDPRHSTLLKLAEALGETVEVISRAIAAIERE